MSLVNYYSSSDDENSSNNGKCSTKSGSGVSSMKLAESEWKDEADKGILLNVKPKPVGLFASLPVPKSTQLMEETNNDDVTLKAASSSTHGLCGTSGGVTATAIITKKRSNQPVKITAPILPERTSDDDDDNEPSSKKAKPAKGLSGLFALLPKPRQATVKQTNRIFIPHTLTKKPTPSKIHPKPVGERQGLIATSYGSEDEEMLEDEKSAGKTSFFSLDGPSTETSGDSKSVKIGSLSVAAVTSANLDPNTVTKPKMPLSICPSVHKIERILPLSTDTLQSHVAVKSTDSQDIPLSFKISNPTISQDLPLEFSSLKHQYGYHSSQYGALYSSYAPPYDEYTQQYSQPYQEPDLPAYTAERGEVQGTIPIDDQSRSSSEDLATDKEFQRLMGKRNIGKETIAIIDINADEQTGPIQQLDWMAKKSLTEEKEYRAKLKKEQLPSTQQRRKHQITFLAHQAKERELELKNQWANNRQTRQQTQMKYGF